MSKARLAGVEALIAMIALAGGFSFPVSAASAVKQRALNSNSTSTRDEDPRLYLNEDDSKSSEMRALIELYASDRGSLARFFSVETSPARRARMKQFYTEWLASLAKLNFDAMSQDGKIDYVLFKNHLDHELRQLDIQEKAYAEVGALTPFASTITDLEDSRRRMEAIDSPKTAALLTKL